MLKREIKCAQNLFIDDLKTSQQNHQKLEIPNEILVEQVWTPKQYMV